MTGITVARGADERTYAIRAEDGTHHALFTTGPCSGRSADETAVGNLIEWSRSRTGAWTVVWLPRPGTLSGAVAIAAARDGVGYLLVPQDDVAADAMHSGPDIWVRAGHAARRSLEAHTVWGSAA